MNTRQDNGYLLLLCIWTLFCVIGSSCQPHLPNYILESDHLPTDVRFRPPIGNGHIATNVLSDTVYMNGLFNGHEDSSSRARIPAYVSVDVNTTSDNDVHRNYVLDMYNGVFKQHIGTSNFIANLTYYAHRKYTRLMVTRLDISRRHTGSGKLKVDLHSNRGAESADFTDWQDENVSGVNGGGVKYIRGSGTVKTTELDGTVHPTLYVFYTPIPAFLELAAEDSSLSATFVASHSTDIDDARGAFGSALDGVDGLLSSHQRTWEDVWTEGRVDVEGNPELAHNIAAATYNILCSLPSQDDAITPFYGLSPGGLSRGGLLVPSMPGGGHNDYAGHVFWDMDTWMMPPIMLLHPGMSRRMIGSRTRVLEQVKVNAKDAGYQGAKFPWEQGTTGIEVTPKWAGNMSRYEIHIGADIAYALRQYLYANDDLDLVKNARGLELALEIARFWQSRVTKTGPNRMDILGVMGPDEYHFNIDNSVYTNFNAKLSLLLPKYILERFPNMTVSESVSQEIDEFETTANQLVILFDDALQYHPQYDGFNLTAGQIKQSDVVLLGYPLMMSMSQQVRRNDLTFYEQITNPQGPDTGTWSMHTVGWLELGDEKRATTNFRMMLRNINEPFKVFSEKPVSNTSTGGCVNFITAAGGMLQAVIFGYGGVRLLPDQLHINPHLLPEATSWRLIGIHYRKCVIDIHVTSDIVEFHLRELPTGVTVHFEVGGQFLHVLETNETVEYSRQPAKLWLGGDGPTNVGIKASSCFLAVFLTCMLLHMYL